jgi:O-acetyl-ADP-ribose deacetylase (regulator of RNase III)
MPLQIIKGDIFTSKADYLVCPVNCDGVMGKGLALQFNKRFPNNYESYYKQSCNSGRLSDIGDFDSFGFAKTGYVTYFATKNHWRNKSDLVLIKQGLIKFIDFMDYEFALLKIRHSYAFPALGCGEGGLNWEDVKAMFEEVFQDCENLIELYEPNN